MKPSNCRRCGKLFVGTGRLCRECLQQDEADFRLVKEYLRTNPSARIFEVTENTGVEPDKIYEFVRQGRLQAVSPDSDLAVRCERCGQPIQSGRLCARCSDQLKKEAEAILSGQGNEKSGQDNRSRDRKMGVEKFGYKGKVHIADKFSRNQDGD